MYVYESDVETKNDMVEVKAITFGKLYAKRNVTSMHLVLNAFVFCPRLQLTFGDLTG